MKKLEKRPLETFNKGSDGQESQKESIHSEDSDDDCTKRKESSLGSVSIEQIQSLIVYVVKAQSGGGFHKTHLYTKPIQKGLTSFVCLTVTSPLSLANSMAKGLLNSTSDISLGYV